MGKRKKRHKTSAQLLRPLSPRLYYCLLAVIVLVSALPRFRLREMPLERDEGEYAYAGQLLLEGIPPYTLAYNMKLPGTYAAYAVIMALFGETPAGIHMGLLVVNAVTTVFIFFLVRRLLNAVAGIVAAASYTLLATSPSVVGFAAHATHFVVLAAISGIMVLVIALESGQALLFLCSGTLLGLAVLMKQPGIFFVIFAALYLMKREWTPGSWRKLSARLGLLLCGAALPFALTCLLLWKAGVFHRFWFWTFTYARHYGTILGLRDAPELFWSQAHDVIAPALLVWIIAATGLLVIFWDGKTRDARWFVAGFLLFSFFAVCPGFYFREHYFILVLPAVSMLAGAAVTLTTEKLRDHAKLKMFSAVPTIAFLAAVIIAIIGQQDFLFEMDPIAACRSIYGANPFPEAVEIADFLKTHTSQTASIAIVGSEPEIYFYSHRHSATGYIYTYALMEDTPKALQMQEEMVSDIEKANPEVLVFVMVPTSWLRHPESPSLIFDWTEQYVKGRYKIAGVVDILSETQYRWGPAAENYSPLSPYTIKIFKRISS